MSFILAGIVAVIFLVADQVTKYIVATNMELGSSVGFLNGFLDFTFTHNDGGAWGMLGGARWLLLASTAIIMVVIVVLIIRNKLKSKLLFWAGSLIISGGIGNMIDRIFNGGKVVDFLEVKFIEFPVFNIADCAVVIGAGLLILYFILDTIKEEKEKKAKKLAENNGSEDW